jgi:hypothetical protein
MQCDSHEIAAHFSRSSDSSGARRCACVETAADKMKLHEPPLEEQMTASYSLTHLTDVDLLRQLSDLVARDRKTTAALIAHLAEVERRKLHLPEGYDSLLSYCVEKLRLSRDEAVKRISAARLGRRFPGIFECLADGRLSLTTVIVLRPYIRRENARELLKAAINRSKSEVVAMLAARFPKSELLPLIDRIPSANITSSNPVAPERLPSPVPQPPDLATESVVEAPQQMRQAEPPHQTPPLQQARAEQQRVPDRRPTRSPIAAQRFGLHLTMPQSLNDKLEYLQELLSHSIPSGDLVEVLEKTCELAIAQLEKTKFGVTSRACFSSPRKTPKGRHIPLAVRREVLKRDGHQCTYFGNSGHRCTARKFLQFDHVDEFACGGEATVDQIRLRCRAHNQYTAELKFGVGFMHSKRVAARLAAKRKREIREKRAASAPESGPSLVVGRRLGS